MSENQKFILEHFKNELEVSKELLTLLNKEELILSHQDLPQLPEITVLKNNLIQRFLQLKTSRHNQLSAYGLPKDESQIGVWISQQSHLDLHQTWAELTNTLQTCQEVNQQIGKMIHKLSASNRAAIQVLEGQDPTQSIYGPGSDAGNISKFNVRG